MESPTKTACLSLPSSALPWKYDVFLSFRGEDTRKGFTSHLYNALQSRGLETFADYSKYQMGNEISQQLLSAIEQSNLSIVVFSSNYTSSVWCLNELSKIIECMEARDAILPIFYHVDPSDVGKQIVEAFTLHQNMFKHYRIEMLERWGAALKKAADLKWKHSTNRHDETQLIKEIVEDVLSKVRPQSQEGLVGIDHRFKQLHFLLDVGSEDVHFIGIWGNGGIGKTTLAKILYERILHKFEGGSFLEGVREVSKTHGLSKLQTKLSKSLMNRDIDNWDIHEEVIIRKFVYNKRVLLILDDVDHISQLETLCGNRNWFGPGSRIIVTTRNEQVLITHGVERRFKVPELNSHEALQLFSWKAFKSSFPDRDYIALSKSILNYASGHPLALEVLGSCLYKRRLDAWSNALCKLKDAFNGEIMDILRISYDELENQEKNIFLDIACFFKGKRKEQVVETLDSLGFCSRISIDVLIAKSLLTVSNNMVWMHDLLQEMGWEIVRQQAQEPGERSRLWHSRDIFDVLSKNLGTKAVEGIVLDLPESKEAQCNPRAFTKMVNLRLLNLHNVHLPHGLKYLSNSLRFLEWSGYPLKSLPSSFQTEKLVELSMCHSSVEQLWSGRKYFDGLKVISLRYSLYLTRTPDFTGIPNLQRLDLEGCERLVEIHPSIGFLKRLIFLNLKDCRSLKILPSKIETDDLESFILSGCSSVKKLPEFGVHMDHLLEISLVGTATEEIPLSIDSLTGLSSLDLRDCLNLNCLPSSIGNLKSLISLDVSGCSKLVKLPESFGQLESLEKLNISGTAIGSWPSSSVLLKKLNSLFFRGPKGLSRQLWHMALPFRLLPMKSRQPMSSFLPSLSGLCSLVELDLSDLNLLEVEIPTDKGCLSSLVSLNLSGNNFISLPESIFQLSKLQNLDLSDCKRLQCIPLLSSNIALEVISDGCTIPRELQLSTNLDGLKLSYFNFINCTGLVDKEGWAFSMLKRHLKRVPCPGDRYEIVIPGSEIPWWFSHQRKGWSISVQLTRHDNKWMGYALCAVFEVFGSGWELNCLLKVNGKEQYPVPVLASDVQPVSDHLWLFYISRELIFCKEWRHSGNQLIFSFKSSGPSFIKKCGVRLVYEQDMEEFNKALAQPSRKIPPSKFTNALQRDENSASPQGQTVTWGDWKGSGRSSSKISPYEFANGFHDKKSSSPQGTIAQHSDCKGLGHSSFDEEPDFKRFKRT